MSDTKDDIAAVRRRFERARSERVGDAVAGML